MKPFFLARWPYIVAVAIIFLAIRFLFLPSVFTPEGVLLPGTDSYYHLRRILYSVENFPGVMKKDPLAFPSGSPSPYPPGLDLFLALVAKMTASSEKEVARVSAMAIPILAFPVLGIYYFVCKKAFPQDSPIPAMIILSILPGHVLISRVGAVDHHFLEPIIAGLFLVLGLPERRKEAAIKGFFLGATFLFYHGAILPASFLFMFHLFRPATASPFLFFSMAWVSTIPGALGPFAGKFTYFAPSLFQPFLLLVFGAILFLRRALSPFVFIALLLAFIPLFLISPLSLPVVQGISFVLRKDRFVAMVAEQLPLLFEADGAFTLRFVRFLYSPLYLLTPLFLANTFRKREGSGDDRTLFAWWASLAFVLSLLQRRFVSFFSPVLAILLGHLYSCIGKTIPKKTTRAMLILTISAFFFEPFLFLFVGSREPAQKEEMVKAMEWLSMATDERSYVMAPWDMGHWITGIARRRAVATPLGLESYERGVELSASFFLSSTEEEALEILSEPESRFIVTTFLQKALRPLARFTGREPALFVLPSGMPGPRFFDTMAFHLHCEDGATLSRMRLVQEFMPRGASFSPCEEEKIKIFEVVKGARIRTMATEAPLFHLRVTTPQGKAVTIERQMKEILPGLFETLSPHSTEGPLSARASLSKEGQNILFAIPERTVKEGLVVMVP